MELDRGTLGMYLLQATSDQSSARRLVQGTKKVVREVVPWGKVP